MTNILYFHFERCKVKNSPQDIELHFLPSNQLSIFKMRLIRAYFERKRVGVRHSPNFSKPVDEMVTCEENLAAKI